MPTSARTSNKTSAAKSQAKEMNAIDLLKADHAKVTEMFEEYEQTQAASKKKRLVAEICQALTAHAQVEEELLYPEAKAALPEEDAKELVPEAIVEHATVKDLIAQIEAGEPGDEMFEARVQVLSEYVKHHVEEEEKEMFPKLKKCGMDLEDLGARMAERMEALRAARH